MMKERPILFSTDMVKAILEGRKTQTRRCQDLERINESPNDWKFEPPIFEHDNKAAVFFTSWKENEPLGIKCRYGQVGDRLWVKHRADIFPCYFKPVPDYEGLYWAGTDGLIYRDGLLVVGCPNKKGYYNVTLSKNGIRQTRNVHDLVCRAFYGEPPEGLNQVRHLDGNNQNNKPENLDWGSQEDNWIDRKYHGGGMGEAHHAAKLTTKQCIEIRCSKKSQRQLATQFGVSQATIWAIQNNKIWSTHKRQKNRNVPAFQLWKSSIFMPRWASRILLEITDIRVERLQEISLNDILAEGTQYPVTQEGHRCLRLTGKCPPCDYLPPELWENGKYQGGEEHWIKAHFCSLWDSINGKKYPWSSNPWVWVISFKVVNDDKSQG